VTYQLLISRAKVSSGDETISDRATVSVRNGVATIKDKDGEQTMQVASIEKGRRSATVTGVDGTVWTVARQGCGCGGGR
jgi:hypothetical protein